MADDLLHEEWRPVAGFPDYEVSDAGRVRRSNPVDSLGRRIGCKILKASLDASTGYRRVTLQRDGEKNAYRHVHVLVCTAFHGPKPSSLHEVGHGDGNRENNVPDNLRWTTNAGNHLDRQLHGRAAKKLTASQVRLIRSSSKRIAALAEQFDVADSSIRRVINRETWAWLEGT